MKSTDGYRDVRLKDGFELRIRENVMDDIELLDLLVSLEEGNGYAISKILDRMFDPETKKTAYDHFRKDGVTSVTDMVNFLKEIFDNLGAAGKN